MNMGSKTFDIFPWNTNLETGIDIVDEQHKQLISLINKLLNTLVWKDNAEVDLVFNELINYAEYHFETEEPIWQSCFGDDPLMVSHVKTHESFLPSVLELKDDQGDKSMNAIIADVIKFLVRWLAFHIVDTDKRMAFVYHNMEAGKTLEDAKELAEKEMSGAAHVLADMALSMYESLSSRTLDLMHERIERRTAQEKLKAANLKLEEMAVTDQLTDLYNRRHFDNVFSQELLRAKREKRSMSFLMIDIDYFKNLNDFYGHLAGDLALKKVSQKLKEICKRPGDYVFRIGGEEFGVLIVDQSKGSGIEFAEKIRLEVSELNIPNVESAADNCLTVSIGVISMVPSSDDTMNSFLTKADSRLYKAKELGRNRVIGNTESGPN